VAMPLLASDNLGNAIDILGQHLWNCRHQLSNFSCLELSFLAMAMINASLPTDVKKVGAVNEIAPTLDPNPMPCISSQTRLPFTTFGLNQFFSWCLKPDH